MLVHVRLYVYFMCLLPQSNWSTLQDKFSPLNPLQLQRVLTRYDCAGASAPSTWFPETQLNADECRLMENFDDHPRLLLPEEGVHLDLSHASSDVSLNNARSRLQLQFARAGSRRLLLKHYRLSLSLPFLYFFRRAARAVAESVTALVIVAINSCAHLLMT